MKEPQESRLRVDESTTVSALLLAPEAVRQAYVFAHGAGAGMGHAFMTQLAEALAARGVATLRYQFPFMENGKRLYSCFSAHRMRPGSFKSRLAIAKAAAQSNFPFDQMFFRGFVLARSQRIDTSRRRD